MKKVIIITAILTVVAVVSLIILTGSGVDAKALIQSDCERVVRDFTKGKPVEFMKKIASDEKDEHQRQNYLGYYVFEDDLYTYIVDPDNLYICRIVGVSNEARALLNVNGEKEGTEEAAAKIAIDIFKNIESKFLVEGGEITTKVTSPGDTMYGIDIDEIKDGIPTGNCARMGISKAGYFLSGVFLLGDSEHIEKLTNEKDKMISFEDAAQIAVDEIKARPDLAAENIQIDDTAKDEMSTRDNVTVRFINLTYYQNGEQRHAKVLIDVFSGKVIDIGFCY